MVKNKKIFITHPDPWDNGISLTWCYSPMWDGPLEMYLKEPYVVKYADGTLCTSYDGETGPAPWSKKTIGTGSIKFEIIDFSKQLNKNKIMTQLNEIDTNLAEGKLLMAAVASLTTSGDEANIKAMEDVLTELNELAEKMFEADEVIEGPQDDAPEDIKEAVETIVNETL